MDKREEGSRRGEGAESKETSETEQQEARLKTSTGEEAKPDEGKDKQRKGRGLPPMPRNFQGMAPMPQTIAPPPDMSQEVAQGCHGHHHTPEKLGRREKET
ncbi:hypothetical protein NDU88_007123 [Pleurodeles waltl]|uniref:Uncharacterized protein n=1 Tax=Pleurodeles waltl TaxID=8319 RepID=A0AAV7SRJ4_PLEWA|nr:hypothetical protein NDU88_007123 [Pleurodeles waltl]